MSTLTTTSESTNSLAGKTCLVTGASAGIGFVTARELTKRGARVLAVGRSESRCAEAAQRILQEGPSGTIEFLLADLSCQADIRRLAEEVHRATNRLDVLINNAGGIFLKRKETIEGHEMTFALNHLAYFLLTNLLLDLLQAAAPARIVSVASSAHRGVKIDFKDPEGKTRYRPWFAYQQSKLANILFTRELARRLEGTGVTANTLHPGYVNTQIFRAEGLLGGLLRLSAGLFAVSPERGAQTSIYLATSPDVAGQSGGYYARCKLVSPSAAAQDDASEQRLWELSEQLTGLART